MYVYSSACPMSMRLRPELGLPDLRRPDLGHCKRRRPYSTIFSDMCIIEIRSDMEGRLEGTKRATSVNVRVPRLQKDLSKGSISRDVANFPSELRRRRGGMFTEVCRRV